MTGSGQEEPGALDAAQREFERAMDEMRAAWDAWTRGPAAGREEARNRLDAAAEGALLAREALERAERRHKGWKARSPPA